MNIIVKFVDGSKVGHMAALDFVTVPSRGDVVYLFEDDLDDIRTPWFVTRVLHLPGSMRNTGKVELELSTYKSKTGDY